MPLRGDSQMISPPAGKGSHPCIPYCALSGAKSTRVALGGVVLYALRMDETTLNELRALAEKNGIDPDKLLEIAGADGLPEELSAALADVLGDLTIFGQALDEKDK